MEHQDRPVIDGRYVTYGGRTMLRVAGGEHVPGEAPVVPPAPAEPAAAPALTGPWASDIESRFTDPDVRTQVDTFLRETVQPHVTRVEQERASLKPAEQLYADIVENPADTYLALTEELFGEDAAKAVQDQLTNLFGTEEETAVTDPTNQQPALPPEDKQAIEWAKEQATRQAYNAELDRIKGLDDFKDVPEAQWNLFHPFVASADGDFDVAAQGFNQWRAQITEQFAPAAPEPEPDPAAPTPLGTEAAQTAPPVQKDYKDIDSAIEDWFAENRAAAPPVVGGV